jgi:hypothetical protein
LEPTPAPAAVSGPALTHDEAASDETDDDDGLDWLRGLTTGADDGSREARRR